MIATQDPNQELHEYLLNRLGCPVCLSDLLYSFVDGKNDRLICTNCKSTFLISDGLPILLINDANWSKKVDEIEGEVDYNIKKIPLEVHLERNDYINRNTDLFFKESGVDLSKDEVLIVGCAQMELEYFIEKCKSVVSLDIVPLLAKGCFVATKERNIPAAWVCGDGECLPFEDECFDTVLVRQSLHHMLKYYSAISEFFRVCKRGGHVLIIDEPFLQPDLHDAPLSILPDEFPIYEEIELGHIRERLGIPISPKKSSNMGKSFSSIRKFIGRYKQKGRFYALDQPLGFHESLLKGKGFRELEKEGLYIKPDSEDPETYLADKYYSFSLLQCILATNMHTKDFRLLWPQKIAWTDESGDTVCLRQGPNPHYEKPLIEKLITAGNVSIAARKTASTTVLRDRSQLQAIPLDLANSLLTPGSGLNSRD